MNELVAAIASIRNIAKVTQALIHTRDEAKLGSLKIELQSEIIELQSKIAGIQFDYQILLESNEALKKKLVAYERWEQESARYSLNEIEPGIFAYRMKSNDPSGEPEHWLCAACYQDRQKSILQPASKGSSMLNCPRDSQHSLLTEAID
jgi:hypothetical protein